jgi:hypothetical protein
MLHSSFASGREPPADSIEIYNGAPPKSHMAWKVSM